MRLAFSTLTLVLLFTLGPVHVLQPRALAENDDEIVSMLVYLHDHVDIHGLSAQLDEQRATLRHRHETVVVSLQNKAEDTQGDLIEHLADLQDRGLVVDFQEFWISNVVRVDAPRYIFSELAEHEDVYRVYPNLELELITPVDSGPAGDRQANLVVESGVEAINADDVWALGYTGAGVLVANIDTGVDGNHASLASRWAGLLPQYAGHPEWAWFDPYTNQNDFPFEGGAGFGFGHGTHTMGTVCGGPPGDEIGVAPGASWMAAGAIDRGGGIPDTVADAIASFQWMIDPDGNPNTNWDVPAVCSNSWGVTSSHGFPPCDTTFWEYLDACEAAGIVIVFSAGNEGSAPNTLRRPSDRESDDYRTFSVGAVDANVPSWPIAGFSSRGPTFCTPSGEEAIKPEISAPGVDVRSASPGGGYTLKSGTSMASPHVNGVVALMREACPDLTVAEIKQIIYDTAVDLGDAGEDNAYGHGMIDAYEAVLLSLDMCGPSPPRVYDGSYETPVDTPVMVTLQASDYDGGPMPISYIISALPETGHTLTDVANDHVIMPGELPYTLANNNNQILYTPAVDYYGYDSFLFKATDGGTPPEGGESEEASVMILTLFDPPTITTEALPDGYLNVPYGPVTIEVAQGQPPLAWTYVTDEYLEVDMESNHFNEIGVAQGWHDDDGAWSYTLPFTFPYYDQEYTSMWITSNGVINFDNSDDDYSNSESELINAVRIAPLWDDLRTDLGGDIYIFQWAPGQLTVRWETVTYANQTPCNHSCTLFSDGRIQFHYGSGNTPLTATVGISKGDGVNYLLSAYNNVSDLGDANSLEIIQPVPLPEGMTISSDGVLSGTPLEFGTYEPRFKVTDSLGRSDERPIPLVIQESGVPGDLNGDGLVNAADLALLLSAWGPNPGPADLNGDGFVDAADLALLIGNWSP